jgi:Zn-dependent M28 family amino/carboxypeptidase
MHHDPSHGDAVVDLVVETAACRSTSRMETMVHPIGRHRPSVVLAALLIAGCSTAPSMGPATIAPTPSATGAAGSPSPVASVAAGGPLADAVRRGISVDDIVADLGRLQAIADANGGTRAAGTPGHDASAEFVAGELEAAGYVVERQQVPITAFTQTAPSVIEITGGPTLEDVRDFKAMTFSAKGDVTGTVVALGFDRNTTPDAVSGLGCSAGDFAGVRAGAIVLVQPGPCRRHDVVVNAQSAGAVAVITSYVTWPRDAVRRPTLVTPGDIEVPVLGSTHAAGLALADAAEAGATVHVSTSTSTRQVQSVNVIAESPWGDPVHVVMLGGHLDSVIDGPGINDNGSGTMTVLEIARTLAEVARSRPAGEQPAWKVRVAFWTGEETGLFGSAAYANTLSAGDLVATEAYLNFDMVGSANGVRVVYQDPNAPKAADEAVIAALFSDALGLEQLAWQPESIGAASDHFPIQQAGIPIGGLYSGANELKTAEEATSFGGTAGAPDDACYHLACDTAANINPTLLGELARAAAWVVGKLAAGEVVLGTS